MLFTKIITKLLCYLFLFSLMRLQAAPDCLFCEESEAAFPRLVLNMIVKNESHVIERALKSVRPWIDYWVIVDTGSTDGTQAVIKNYFDDIPGELVEREWVNFAYNRNEALELAKRKGQFILFLDADDWLEIGQEGLLLEQDRGAYLARWFHGESSYEKPLIINGRLPWRWEGEIHEYLTCDSGYSAASLNHVKYCYGGNGARSQDPEKYQKAVAVLEGALKRDPKNLRNLFYLAESLRDAGRKEEAIAAYLRRVESGGWDEECFWALFQVACLKDALGYSKEEVIESFYRAHRFRPHRPEPVYYLAQIFNEEKRYALAYSVIKGYLSIPQPHPGDILFRLDWITNYGLDFQLSLSAYYLGFFEEFRELCEGVLAHDRLPKDWAICVENNLSFLR